MLHISISVSSEKVGEMEKCRVQRWGRLKYLTDKETAGLLKLVFEKAPDSSTFPVLPFRM